MKDLLQWVFAIIVAGVMVVGLWNVGSAIKDIYVGLSSSNSYTPMFGGSIDADFTTTKKLGVCTSESMEAELGVYEVKFKDPSIGGMYTQWKIYLSDTSVKVIAHEVSHYVDAVVQSKGIRDGETRAYLQGFFTQCVYDKVHEN